MTSGTTRRVMLLLVVLTNAGLTGCLSQEGATCPLPKDGVCAPIHVVDLTWKTSHTEEEVDLSTKVMDPKEGDLA